MRRILALLGLFACAQPPEQIPKDELARWVADVVCRRTAECMRGTFESTFYGRSDCRATLERDYGELVRSFDDAGCDYSAGAAGDAVIELDEMTCEQFYEGDGNEAVAEIWADCGPTYPTYPTSYTYTM